jgi:hypothetical protein
MGDLIDSFSGEEGCVSLFSFIPSFFSLFTLVPSPLGFGYYSFFFSLLRETSSPWPPSLASPLPKH